jgi:DNA (cytosine-5)-methyltransferase 1
MGKKSIEETLSDETDKLVREVIAGCAGIIGGWPCQDISIAGKQKGIQRNAAGEATTRSGLVWEMVRIVCMVRPKFWLMENVAEIFTRELGVVLGAVAECGYDAEWDCVGAGTVGAPHHRARAYILAYADSNGWERHFPIKIRRQHEFAAWENIRTVEDIKRMPNHIEPLIRGAGNGVAKRLHGIGNANPPCVIRELTKNLKESPNE